MQKILLVILIIFLLGSLILQLFLKDVNIDTKGEAILSWNHSLENDLRGYNIYYGTSPRTDKCPRGGYENKIGIGNKTNYKLKDLDNNKTYYFSVTSYNNAGKESCFSEEMKKKISINFLDKIKKVMSQKIKI